MSSEQDLLEKRGRETVERTPKIIIDLYISAHATAFDRAGLADCLLRVDAYAPEFFGWDAEIRDLYRRVSEGKLGSDEAVRVLITKGFDPMKVGSKRAEFQAIYSKKMPVIMVDVPLVLAQDFVRRPERFVGNPEFFGDVLNSLWEQATEVVRTEAKREDFIISNAISSAQELQELDPKLVGKEEIHLLLSLGGYHAGVFHGLDKENKGKLAVGPGLLVYPFEAELARRIQLNQPVDNLLLARVYLEKLFSGRSYQGMNPSGRNPFDLIRRFRAAAMRMSFDDIQEIFLSGKDSSKLAHEKLRKAGLDLGE